MRRETMLRRPMSAVPWWPNPHPLAGDPIEMLTFTPLEPRMIYLAGPYSHDDQGVRHKRFEALNRKAAHLIADGHIVFSPISMTHPVEIARMAMDGSEPRNTDYWCDFDEAFMAFCTEIHVLKLDGWEQSKGVAREIAYFEQRGRPVIYAEPM